MPDFQDYPEPPYLEWEMILYLDLLKMPMSMFDSKQMEYDSAIKHKRKLTINQFRKQIPNVTPHPDERGNKKVYELAEARDTDAIIPAEQLVGAWNKLIMTVAGMREGRPPFEIFVHGYNELYLLAKAVGSPQMLEDYPPYQDVINPPEPLPEEEVSAISDEVSIEEPLE